MIHRIAWQAEALIGLLDPAVTLCSPDSTYGVRDAVSLEVFVSANEAMAQDQDDPEVFWYEFEDEEEGAEQRSFDYFVRVADGDNVYYINGRISGAAAPDPWNMAPNTLGWIRWHLVEASGNASLVRDYAAGDYTDAGRANFMINAACRWLDRELNHPKSDAILFKTLAPREEIVTFRQARHVNEVRQQADSSAAWHYAVPISWTPVRLGLAPDQQDMTAETLPAASGAVMFGDHYPWQAIRVHPADASRTVLVKAAWYSRDLVNDLDRNFWTVQHPDLLLDCARMHLEKDLRGSQGVRDFFEPLKHTLQRIAQDLAMEEQAGPAGRFRIRG